MLSDWLRKQGVPPGEWYPEAKAFARAAMRAAGLSVNAVLVLICLRLHTMPYQSELAVTMLKNKRRPITPTDIAKETGLSRQNVRRALAELEAAGFAQRRPIGEGGLRKGNVEVYCWTVPRPPSESKIVVTRDYNLPKEILKLVRRFRIPLPDDFVATRDYKVFVEEAAKRYKEAEIVAAHELKRAFFVAPGAPAYKEERKSLKETAARAEGSEKMAAAPPPIQPISKTPTAESLPKTTAAIRERFPSTDDQFISRLVGLCRERLDANGKPQELATDELIAKAVVTCHKKGQTSAGLYPKTVPQCVETWICTEEPMVKRFEPAWFKDATEEEKESWRNKTRKGATAGYD